jgi:hypothetical protein
MKTKRKLGIWMNRSIAHLMEISHEPFEVTTIESELEIIGDKIAVKEVLAPSKIKQLQLKYYNNIRKSIQDFYYVVIFGPTDAKRELFDILAEDESLAKVKVEIKETDEMNTQEKHEFVQKYFSTL